MNEQEEMTNQRVSYKWNLWAIGITGLVTLLTLCIYIGVYVNGPIHIVWDGFCVTGLHLGIDRFRGLYGFICALIWFVSMVVSRELLEKMEHSTRFYVSILLTFLATLGIFYADDLALVYIFFEVMSLSSYIWVAQNQTEESKRVSDTYLFVSVTSGLVMLMGVIVLWCNIGTLEFEAMRTVIAGQIIDKGQLYLGGGCLLFGFGAKAGAFPMHFYLHTAYPTAPAPASAILSAALTKAGIFGILILTGQVFYHDSKWGFFLVVLGVVTMLFNAVWGIFQMNVFKILACSSVSQLGFIMLGCGMINMLQEESALAIQGTILYMVNHSMFKLILFLACGVLCKQVGSQELTKLKGIGRQYKNLLLPILTGCAGLAGVPLFSGYIAKTLLHESIVEYIHIAGGTTFHVIEWLFLIAGGCTLAYVTKIFVMLFVEQDSAVEVRKQKNESSIEKTNKNSDSIKQQNKDSIRIENSSNHREKKIGNKLTIIAIWIPTVLSLLGGLLPYITMNKISNLESSIYQLHEIHYFTLENLKGSAISILIGCIIYFALVRPFLSRKNVLPEWMNFENLIYRPLVVKVLPTVSGAVAKVFDGFIPISQNLTVALLSGTAIGLDDIVPALQKVGTYVLEKAAIGISLVTDFIIVLLQNSIFNSNKVIHLKRNENAEILIHEISQTNRIIQASLSFGFLMVCLGLCATLLYLLLG